MVGNGRTRWKIVGNCGKCWEMVEIVKNGGNGGKWRKIVANVGKWWEIVKNGRKW